MRKWLLLGALAVGLLAPLAASAQAVVQDNLSGNETWQAGQGPGGPGGYITSNLVRNSVAAVPLTISGNFTVGTGTTASLSEGGMLLVGAQPSAATITLPPNPLTDGAVVAFCNVTATPFATNVVSFVANTGQALVAGPFTVTTQGANSCSRFVFRRANTSWYKVS